MQHTTYAWRLVIALEWGGVGAALLLTLTQQLGYAFAASVVALVAALLDLYLRRRNG